MGMKKLRALEFLLSLLLMKN